MFLGTIILLGRFQIFPSRQQEVYNRALPNLILMFANNSYQPTTGLILADVREIRLEEKYFQ